MATISNVKLAIKKGRGSSKVSLTYTLCFSGCELMDETTFVERVSLKGDDGILRDDHLTTLHNSCVKANKKCINRKIERTVANSTLNEDSSFFNRTDEVYALIELTPFKPRKAAAKSNIEYDRF